MVECPNCNKTYDDEFRFCPFCGEKKPEGKICLGCKYESYEYDFCPKCGRQLFEKHVYDERDMLYGQINKYESLKKYEEELECVEKVLELAPSDETSWFVKGECLQKLERYDEAILCYDKTLENIPSGTYSFYKMESWLEKGKCFEKLERYDDAIGCYDKVIAKEDYTIMDIACSYKADLLRKLGRNEEADKTDGWVKGLAECEMIADRLNEEYLNGKRN